MSRLTNEELESIKKQYNVDTIYSWSRVNCFTNSPYEYFLKYIKHASEDKVDSSYGTLGSISHEVLDRYYENKIKYQEMFDEFNDGWITAIDIMNLKFNRTDEERNQKLKIKYKENLDYFFRNHIPYKYKLFVEKPIKININGNIFIGYIDAVYKDEDSCYNILDFKTSSIYKGKKLEEHSGQLMMYALGLHQSGIPLEKIKIGFNFLKYVSVNYELANGKVKNRICERSELGKDLQSNVSMWLTKCGYEPDKYLKEFEFANNTSVLPKEIASKYQIEDCHVFIPLDNKLIDKWNKTINDTLIDIKLREKEYKNTFNEKIWWDSDESLKKQEYYFYNICGYSGKLHKPWGDYLDRQTKKPTMTDINGFNVEANTNEASNNQSDDLSWINSIEV